jgi:hypothetical protein
VRKARFAPTETFPRILPFGDVSKSFRSLRGVQREREREEKTSFCFCLVVFCVLIDVCFETIDIQRWKLKEEAQKP